MFASPKKLDGKEICDLLVLFNDTLIIFQIKDVKLHNPDSLLVNGKWKEKDFEKNIRQIKGAKKYLFETSDSLEFENIHRKVNFEKNQIKHTHLVAIFMGLPQDYGEFIRREENQIIHIFTQDFLEIAMKELDTINDFCNYLKKKQNLVSNNDNFLIIEGGEKELLAEYLINDRNFLHYNGANGIMINEGIYDNYIKSDSYLNKIEKNKSSYVWDYLIEKVKDVGFSYSSSEKLFSYEEIGRDMALADRFTRRILSDSFIDGWTKIAVTPNLSFSRFFSYPVLNTTYCFLYLGGPEDQKIRSRYLNIYCQMVRINSPENPIVIGIATESLASASNSFIFCKLLIPEITNEDIEWFEQMKKETGFFKNTTFTKFEMNEY